MLPTTISAQSLDFSAIKAVSGSGQQHGSVYWKMGSAETLANLAVREFMQVL
eukprot:SAG31_NODE_7350_length_1712_cov_1.873528_2_plen_52_part_00